MAHPPPSARTARDSRLLHRSARNAWSVLLAGGPPGAARARACSEPTRVERRTNSRLDRDQARRPRLGQPPVARASTRLESDPPDCLLRAERNDCRRRCPVYARRDLVLDLRAGPDDRTTLGACSAIE